MISILKEDIYQYVVENTKINSQWAENNAKKISEYFNVSRNVASQYLNEFCKEGLIGKINSRPVLFLSLPKRVARECNFSSMEEATLWMKQNSASALENVIGSKGSLREIIQQIKAAVQYPPNGLPILLHGATGTGKSFFAQAIYQHLKTYQIIDAKSDFIAVNCSEYANNPELFLANFFGFVKGAYTGADETRKGLAELANGGVLFLDEVHSLSNECQEKLFQFMDTNRFHRMGDNESWYESHCRIVFATSELPEENLLATLIRRIPVKVTLPTLQSRSITEKKQLIQIFFEEEAVNLNQQILVSNHFLAFILNNDFSGNIGNLKNVIKLSCANAFSSIEQGTVLKVQMANLPGSISRTNPISSLTNVKVEFLSIDELMNTDHHLSYSQFLKGILDTFEANHMNEMLFDAFDKFFKKQFHRVQVDMSNDHSGYLEVKFRQYIKILEKDYQRKVDFFYLKISLFYLNQWVDEVGTSLSIAEIERLYDFFVANCSREFAMVEEFSNSCDISFSKIEKAILILIFRLMIDKNYTQSRLALIIAHGESTATSIAKTVNTLLGDFIFDAINMPLQSTSEEVSEQVNKYLKERSTFDELILLVDMGSLEKIHERLELPANKSIGLLNNVSTKMALDVANQLSLKIPLKDILTSIQCNHTIHTVYHASKIKRDMILCSCASGLGTSYKLKSILESSFPKVTDILIETCDFYSLANENYIDELEDEYNILFIVGTLNPELEDKIFYSIEELILGLNINELASKLQRHFSEQEITILNQNILKNFSLTNLMEQLTILNPSKLLEQVSDAIYILQNDMNLVIDNNICFGLYVHISCLIERLVTQSHLQDEISLNFDDPKLENFYHKFKKAFTVVEQYYSVEIPPFEVSYVYDYIKKA